MADSVATLRALASELAGWQFFRVRPKPSSSRTAAALRRAYALMRAQHGHQHWWPGETPFEVCVGAILTQNTSWTNVERAIANLKRADLLEARRLLALPEAELAVLLRPTGYFNLKAQRLRAFLRVLVEDFAADLSRLFAGPTPVVRARLLAIHGIGPETADCLLLYAGGHPSFVVDAYTKRIFHRHGWGGAGRSEFRVLSSKSNTRAEYAALQALCSGSLSQGPAAERLDYWQDYHAQLVVVGKDFCRPREARCERCPLKPLLPNHSACLPRRGNAPR